MENKAVALIVVLIGLIAVVPSVYSQEATPVKIDDVAPFWAKLFQGFFFSGSTADYQCRSTWECTKFTSGSNAGQYRYECYADSLSSTGCLCYATTDPSKCQTNQPSTTTTTVTTTTSGCSDSDNSNGDAMSQGTLDASIFTKGTTSVGGNIFTDSCYGSILYERTCWKGSVGTWGFSCSNGCSNGACVSGAGGTGSGCKYSNPACPSGQVCDDGRNVCVQIKNECTQGKEQCSSNKIQFCDQDIYGGTYWRDVTDCSPDECQILSTGKGFCGTIEEKEQVEEQVSQKGCAFDDPVCASGYQCIDNNCVSKEEATQKTGSCANPTRYCGIFDVGIIGKVFGLSNDECKSVCSESLTKKEFARASENQIAKTTCEESRNCNLREGYDVLCVDQSTANVDIPEWWLSSVAKTVFTRDIDPGVCLAEKIADETAWDTSFLNNKYGGIPLWAYLAGLVGFFILISISQSFGGKK